MYSIRQCGPIRQNIVIAALTAKDPHILEGLPVVSELALKQSGNTLKRCLTIGRGTMRAANNEMHVGRALPVGKSFGRNLVISSVR